MKNQSPAGIIQQLIDENQDGEWDSDAPRLAVMRFDAPNNNIKMEWCAGSIDKISVLINTIASDKATPDKNNSNAPLDKAITSAIDYYKNRCGADCGCNDPSGSVRCRKNFIITIGGGNATDINSIDRLMQKIKESHTSDIREDLDRNSGHQFLRSRHFRTGERQGNPEGYRKIRGICRFKRE